MNILFGEKGRSDKPRRLRVKVCRDQWGQIQYLLQAKYFLFWQDNYQTTRSPKSLLWCVRGLGMHLRDLAFVTEGNVKVDMEMFKALQYSLDYFPHQPPKKGGK